MTDLKELKQNVLMTAKKAHDEKLMRQEQAAMSVLTFVRSSGS